MNTATTQVISSATPTATNFTLGFAMSSACNLAEITGFTSANPSVAASTVQLQVARNGTLISQPITTGGGAAVEVSMSIGPVYDLPNTTGATTYAIYAKGNGSNNDTLQAGALTVKEIAT
jgi:hypothetical protein